MNELKRMRLPETGQLWRRLMPLPWFFVAAARASLRFGCASAFFWLCLRALVAPGRYGSVKLTTTYAL